MQNRWLKWQVAAIAASGIVTVGVVVTANAQEPPAGTSGMSFGQTTTSTTSMHASPTLKATKPKGF